MKKRLRQGVVLADIHYPNHSKACLEAIRKFLKDFKCDFIVFLGDQMSLDMVSFWNKNKPKLNEGQRLMSEYDGFDRDILTPILELVPKRCEKVWFIGNHEYRANSYIEEHPELEGLLESERYLKLEDRGFKVVKFNNQYRLGKLILIHGRWWNKYHTAKTVDEYENSICYAHTHNPQEYYKTTPKDTGDYHGAICLPCLCDTNPDYLKNQPNRWINGFGIAYIQPSGLFNLYKVIINKDSFVWNGKVYQS